MLCIEDNGAPAAFATQQHYSKHAQSSPVERRGDVVDSTRRIAVHHPSYHPSQHEQRFDVSHGQQLGYRHLDAYNDCSSSHHDSSRRFHEHQQQHMQHQRHPAYAMTEPPPPHPFSYGISPAPPSMHYPPPPRGLYHEHEQVMLPNGVAMLPYERLSYDEHIARSKAMTAVGVPHRRSTSTEMLDVVMNGGGGGGGVAADQRPTYVGYIKSAHDAILLLSACDLQQQSSSSNAAIPPPRRVTRRLLDAERADMVASGCVFAWDEQEAGMKRWTDGRVWSASRVSGCFLTYRELEARKKASNAGPGLDGPTSNQYKPEGLIKQSFSVTTSSGRKLHVISYLTKRDVREGRLRRVSEDPRFVGEGGGEWGLTVDESEYSFPDSSHRNSASQQGGADSATDANGNAVEQDDSDASLSTDDDEGGVVLTVARTLQHNPRKRSVPEGADYDREATTSLEQKQQQQRRVMKRPPLTRVRSSSLSDVPSSGGKLSGSGGAASFNSLSSSSTEDTTVLSSDVPTPSSSYVNLIGGGVRDHHRRSAGGATRAVISPTLPRESAIRGGACDLKPTDSQDSANAVGALLSLASHRSDPVEKSGALPERRDSDRDTLNMFSVRL